MRRSGSIAAVALLLPLTGCHSHYIQATIRNGTGVPLNVLQVDYPSASFGTQQLAPGGVFQYRFKLLGSGPVSITYIDAHNAEHKQKGPWLNEGQEGQLDIVMDAPDHATFQTRLKP